HAKAMRGWNPPLSGRINDASAVLAMTGVSDLNPGARSKLTRRPYRSVIGASYSHRTPSVSVTDAVTCQSSVKNALVNDWRKYLSAFPNAMELVVGIPERKSAKSLPVAAPVKVNVPRASFCDRRLNS